MLREIAVQAAAIQADPGLAAKECFDLLDRLVAWANGRAGFGALPDRDLTAARARLSDLLGLADEALKARRKGLKGSFGAEAMPIGDVVRSVKGGL